MVRVFLINTADGIVCVNETSEEICLQHLANGARELTREEIASVFKDRPHCAGDSRTKVIGDSLETAIVTYEYPTSEEILEEQANTVRNERDRLLARCDKFALPDYPHSDDATRVAWLQYRQALRDISEQPGFPSTVSWPAKPE